ncbi:MAG: adenosylcobalamin-dependent ribonucleoside-diphosphate reductase [Methylococcaceae bacterium]|nr:MAG: adenosylcobalamin-dependent ribonucleoside-diphosphate reductase [Methylococcaceae bacterium]
MREELTAGITPCVWNARYRADIAGETAIEDSWHRVAKALASVETSRQAHWERRFYRVLEGFRFLPGGRILAGAGSGHALTLFNCFVMGKIKDSLDGIFNALKEGALTMQCGGGVGYDFSTLRPCGFSARRSGAIASGPVSFMHIWDSMCATILSTGARRGAMMGVLRCDHPDIEAFAAAKRDARRLRHFNLSVLVSDDFMRAVRDDAAWALRFPPHGAVVRRLPARELWERIMRAAYDCAEPGVIFIDTVNRANNLWYCERISATNPCGEIPLPPYGACNLGSINLTRFVQSAFTPQAALDLEGIAATACLATRMLDNVYDLAHFPLPRQAKTARASRRIGLGLTGLADALIMLGIPYGSERSLSLAGEVMRTICRNAYRTSVALAEAKGAFAQFDARRYPQGEFIRALPPQLVQSIRRHGLRNSHLTAIAPAGSISLLAGNVSSGLEPVFEFSHQRRIRATDGQLLSVDVEDYAYRLYRSLHGEPAKLPAAFVKAAGLSPLAHLEMQAALQAHVDNAISKTINVPRDYPFEDFRALYQQAYARGLKGCTAFRPNPVTSAVLLEAQPERKCCVYGNRSG